MMNSDPMFIVDGIPYGSKYFQPVWAPSDSGAQEWKEKHQLSDWQLQRYPSEDEKGQLAYATWKSTVKIVKIGIILTL